MAKRKLNKKFVGMLVASFLAVCALGTGAYVLRGRLFKEAPDKYIALGQKFLEEKDYANARDNFARAMGLSRPDPALYVMLGDALNGLASKDRDNVAGARNLYEQAIGIDSGYVPAFERLIGYWRDDLDLRIRSAARSQTAEQLRKISRKLLDVSKDNPMGRAAWAESVIEVQVDGVLTNPNDLKDAQDMLVKLQAEKPADADLPYYLARSMLWQSQEAARTNNPRQQQQFLADADRVMSDAIGRQPANAFMHYRFGQLLLILASSDHKSLQGGRGKDLVARTVHEIDIARQLVKSDDEHYVDICLYDARLVLERPTDLPTELAVQMLAPLREETPSVASVTPSAVPAVASGGDRIKVAEGIYRDVLKNRPNDPATRLALAELLGALPGGRDEAIALLSKPLVDDQIVPGIKGTLLPLFQIQANMKLLGLKLDQLEAARDKAVRTALFAECDELCDRVYSKSPDSASVLALKGRLELAHHRIVEATQTMRRGLGLMDPGDSSIQRARYDLMFNLARAYLAAQQTGEAKKLASDVVSVYSHFIPARLMLARLLIVEHSFAEAKPHIDYLESILPDNPQLLMDVVRMRVATLDPVNEPAKLKEYYDKAPEGDRNQRLDKAVLASLAHYDDDAIRLYSMVHAETPSDGETAINLANLYLAKNLKDKAVAALAQTLAVNPSDMATLALKMQIEGKTPAQIEAAQLVAPGGAPSLGSAVATKLIAAQAAASAGDTAGREKLLAAAEKLSPDDGAVCDALFMLALEQRNWDRATTYLEKLANGNADHAGGLLYRVRYALARGEVQKASELALQLTREKPEFSQSWCVLGEVQRTSGQYEDAIQNFQLALDRQTQNLDAISGLIQCSYALDRKDAAKQYIDMGRRIAPGSELFKEYELNHELAYGDPQKVVPPRLTALNAAPDSRRNWLNLAIAYTAVAKANATAGDPAASVVSYTKARDTLAEAIVKFPDDDEVSAGFAKAALTLHDFAGAEKAIQTLCARDSHKDLAQSSKILADFYEAAGKPDEAAKVLNDYLAHPATTPDHTGQLAAEIRLSNLLAREHRMDDALGALSLNAQDPQIIRQKVTLLLDDHRLADADKVLTDAAATSPLGPELLNLKGMVALNRGQISTARQVFDQVLAAQPDNLTARFQRAQAILREPAPDYAAAIDDLTRARSLSPLDMDIRLLIADSDRRRGNLDDAVRELESAVRAAPSDKRVRLSLIELYASAKPPQWVDAERVLKEARQMPQFAQDADLLHAEAIISLGKDQLSKANDAIRAAMSKSPGNLGMVHTYYDILVKSKAFSQLLTHSDQLLAGSGNNLNLWWVYPYRATARSHGDGDRAGAAAEFQRGLELATNLHDEAALSQIMHSYSSELGVEPAVRVAIARAQNNDHWRLIAAVLCREKGDIDASLTWLEMILGPSEFDKLSPADQDGSLRLAAIEYQARTPPDFGKAAAVYRRLVDRFPDDSASLNNIACLLLEPGTSYDPKSALIYSERAYNQMMRANVDEPQIKDTYGWSLIANGRIDEGVTLVQQALGKRDFPDGHYHLAQAYLKRQPPSPEEAAAELTKAMRILDQAELDGKPVDAILKQHIMDDLKKTREGLPG